MTPLQQIAVPAQDGLRTSKKPQPAQYLPGQRCQECGQKDAVLRSESHPTVDTKLPFQDSDLVTQRKDFSVFVPIPYRQQSQHGEGVRHGEIGQPKKHSRSSGRARLPFSSLERT